MIFQIKLELLSLACFSSPIWC